MDSLATHVEKGCLIQAECAKNGNQVEEASESMNQCCSHRQHQMLIQKIGLTLKQRKMSRCDLRVIA